MSPSSTTCLQAERPSSNLMTTGQIGLPWTMASGQGNPLSMLLYLFYNADLLDVTQGLDEKSLGYVYDIVLLVTACNFTQVHRILKNIMLQSGGAFRWSTAHNSRFETTKSVLIDFSQSKTVTQPTLSLCGSPIP